MQEGREYRFMMGGGNWGRIGAHIGTTLFGYSSPLPKGSQMAIIMGDPGGTCLDSPLMLHRGECDVAMTTPNWYGATAYHGKGDFSEPLNVRAIVTFPHDDRLVFAAREETGLRSLHEVRERKVPLKVAVPASHMRHPTGLVAEQILAEYGITLQDVEAWGGKVLPRLALQTRREQVVDPSFDMVIDEAIMTPAWGKLTQQYDLRFLPVDEDVLTRLEARGIPRAVLPKGRFRGVTEDVPTFNFSGWCLMARGDLPAEFTYLLAKDIDEHREEIHEIFAGPYASMTSVPDLAQSARELDELRFPLHPGAEQYYRERGYL
jgi:TRAP-type uncharacterized transport system substrate-binding protein